MADNPNTLPADFFSRPKENPDTLPADFFANRRGGSGGNTSRGGRNAGGGQGSDDAAKLKGNALTDFVGGVADTTVKTIPSLVKTAGHVAQAMTGNVGPAAQDVSNAVQAQTGQWDKAKEAWRHGEHIEAGGHALAAALPIVGPAAADVGETIGGEVAYDDPEHPDRATGLVRAPQVARGIGQGVGLIASSSPKNIMEPIATKVAETVGKIPVPEKLTPEGLYASSLKIRPGIKGGVPARDAVVKTGLREGVPVSRGGFDKTGKLVDELLADDAAKIAPVSAKLGPDINPLDVTKPVNRLKPTFENQVNPSADLNAIKDAKSEFLDKHSTSAPYTTIAPNPYGGNGMVPTGSGAVKTKQPFTVADAQTEKTGTYRQLRGKYGELGSANIEAQKQLARGLKDEITKRVPGLNGVRESELIALEEQLGRFVAREGNKNTVGLIPSVLAAGSGALVHGAEGAASGGLATLAIMALDNPAIKSRIAIALDRARSGVSAKGIGKTAAVTGAAGTVAKSLSQAVLDQQEQQ